MGGCGGGGHRKKSGFKYRADIFSEYAWFEDNAGELPHGVAQKKPNKYWSYDMQGNVREWTDDRYDPAYYAVRHSRDPKGPEHGREHVIRGGSWSSDADSYRATNRVSYSKTNCGVGFRCTISGSDVSVLVWR